VRMGLFDRFRRVAGGPQPGDPYQGPACWCDDYQLVPRPGYYALDSTGKQVLGNVPLVCVDDAPGDEQNGACHYEYAGPKDNPQRQGRIVALEAHIEGRGGMSA